MGDFQLLQIEPIVPVLTVNYVMHWQCMPSVIQYHKSSLECHQCVCIQCTSEQGFIWWEQVSMGAMWPSLTCWWSIIWARMCTTECGMVELSIIVLALWNSEFHHGWHCVKYSIQCFRLCITIKPHSGPTHNSWCTLELMLAF